MGQFREGENEAMIYDHMSDDLKGENPELVGQPAVNHPEIVAFISSLGLDPNHTGDMHIEVRLPIAGVALVEVQVSMFMTEEQLSTFREMINGYDGPVKIRAKVGVTDRLLADDIERRTIEFDATPKEPRE